MFYILEVYSSQGNGRKGISAARFYTDAHVLTNLIVNGRDL